MTAVTVLTNFFTKVEETYKEAVTSIKKLIDEGNVIHTSHREVNFMLHLISRLRQNISDDDFKHTLEEVLKGGYLKIEDDNGVFYEELVALYKDDLNLRSSSHNSVKQQYSIFGPVMKEVLFGVSEDKDGKKTTWIQFERHHTRSVIEFILHMFDYILHKWKGKNIGPFGESAHTEHDNPMILKPGNPGN